LKFSIPQLRYRGQNYSIEPDASAASYFFAAAAITGGEVTVESHEGEGTTFTLLLPASAPTARDLSEAS
jgi:5-enolpyruvylshikimate-3-phosphate synthase